MAISNIDYTNPYALLSAAANSFLGRAVFVDSSNWFSSVWFDTNSDHALENQRVLHYHTNLLRLGPTFTKTDPDYSQDMQAQESVRLILTNKKDIDLIFFLYYCLITLSTYHEDDCPDESDYDQQALIQLLSKASSFLKDRHIDFHMFMHVLQLPVQPTYHALSSTFVDRQLQLLFPDVFSASSVIQTTMFVPIWDKFSQAEWQFFATTAAFSSTFGEMWSRVPRDLKMVREPIAL